MSTAWKKTFGSNAPPVTCFMSHLLHNSGTAESLLKAKYKNDEGKVFQPQSAKSAEQAKYFRIAYRLLLQANLILTTGKPSLTHFKEEEWDVFRGTVSVPPKDELLKEVTRIREESKKMKKQSSNPSRDVLNDFVLSLCKLLVDSH